MTECPTNISPNSYRLRNAVSTALNDTLPAVIRANCANDDDWKQRRDDPRDCYEKALSKHLENEIDGWFLPPGFVSIQGGARSHTWIVYNKSVSHAPPEPASDRASIVEVEIELLLAPNLDRSQSIESRPHAAIAGEVAPTQLVPSTGMVDTRDRFACVLIPCRPPSNEDLEETVRGTLEHTKDSVLRAFGVGLTRKFYQVLLGWPWSASGLHDTIDPGEYVLFQAILHSPAQSSVWDAIPAPPPHRLQIALDESLASA